MISDVIKLHKSRIQYIKKCPKSISSFIGVSKAMIILYEENMIIKYIPKKEKTHTDKLIEEYIKANFYNQKNLLVHYEELKGFIILYCIITNVAIDKISNEYRSISIMPIQHIITTLALKRTKYDGTKFIFFQSSSSIMFLLLHKRVLLYTTILKDISSYELKNQIFDSLKELTDRMSVVIDKGTVIIINHSKENQKDYFDIFDSKNYKILEINIAEGELISSYGKKYL